MCGRQPAAECLQEAQGERCALMLGQPPANGCPICAMFKTTQRSVGPRWHMSAECVHTFWRAVGTSVLAVCNRPCAVKSATADCPRPPHHHNLPCCAQPSTAIHAPRRVCTLCHHSCCFHTGCSYYLPHPCCLQPSPNTLQCVAWLSPSLTCVLQRLLSSCRLRPALLAVPAHISLYFSPATTAPSPAVAPIPMHVDWPSPPAHVSYKGTCQLLPAR